MREKAISRAKLETEVKRKPEWVLAEGIGSEKMRRKHLFMREFLFKSSIPRSANFIIFKPYINSPFKPHGAEPTPYLLDISISI